jgi:hypothetical protein
MVCGIDDCNLNKIYVYNVNCYSVMADRKLAAKGIDFILPYRASYISFGPVHHGHLEVELEADLRTGIDLVHTGRITNSGEPIDPQDLITKQYDDYGMEHLLSAKGDILGNTAGPDGVLTVGTDGQFLRRTTGTPLGLSWFTEPEVDSRLVSIQGPWAAPVSGTITYITINGWTMMRWPAMLAPFDHASTVGWAAPRNDPPAQFRPLFGVMRMPLLTLNNGVVSQRRIELYADFGVIIASFGGPGPGNCGILAQTLCYCRA